ncbi:hypothetical protein, partial [Tenacibaculum maritimum]|uniref:hypothetical protein n=1 Tax=Tenacibaculum maritimum TaxID=107401 RepID=UPI00133045CD
SDETVSVEGTVKNEVAEGESFKASELVGLKPNGLKDKANNTAIASVQIEEPVAQLADKGSPKQNTTQQTISINQTFTIDQNVEQKIEEIADKVLGRITGKLKDYQLA